MTSSDGRYTLVFNGEIYSHVELRRELVRLGRTFRSSSDTEVLVEAWREWGVDVLARLAGMFAFAVLDRQSGEVLLARDHFGIKPLFFGAWRGGFAFASEVRALLEFPGCDRGINPHRLHTFLTALSSDFGDDTMFAGVRQVPAAHYVVVSKQGEPGVPIRYWSPEQRTRTDLTMDAAAERMRELFLESVRLHLRSDVPIGFALSGGLDSSSVVASARRVMGPAAPLHTFSFIPQHPLINETRFSDEVTRETGSVPHAFTLQAEDLAADFDVLTDAQGEPISSPVVYAQYGVFARAREEGVKVVLTGEGADELLAGYDRFAPARLVSLLRAGRLSDAVRLIHHARVLGSTGAQMMRGALRRVVPGPLLGAARVLRRAAPQEPWIARGWFADRDVVLSRPVLSAARSTLRAMQYRAVEEDCLPALLRFQDRNAMAFSVENRVPFLTPALAELAFSLPEEYLLTATGSRKAVFRKAMEGIVPTSVLERRRKMGFTAPAPDWLASLEGWVEGRLSAVDRLPFFDSALVRRHWESVRSARSWTGASVVFRCISVAAWMERYDVAW
jgi:asparagine synthase (glutamine-hydrolysing)